MPIRSNFFRSFNSLEENNRAIKELEEKIKRNKPPGPPFKPLKTYVEDKVIHGISLLLTNVVENSLKKSGYIIKKGKKDALKNKYYSSITIWGKGTNSIFRHISSEEFICKTFFKTVIPFFNTKHVVVSDLSTIIEEVIKQIDFPPLKEWLNNEYFVNKKYQEYRKNADYEMNILLNDRKSESYSNVSSSPITSK